MTERIRKKLTLRMIRMTGGDEKQGGWDDSDDRDDGEDADEDKREPVVQEVYTLVKYLID
jgi:hypothetical protein